MEDRVSPQIACPFSRQPIGGSTRKEALKAEADIARDAVRNDNELDSDRRALLHVSISLSSLLDLHCVHRIFILRSDNHAYS